MHAGQKTYGYILKFRILRQEIISKILEGRAFWPTTRNFMKDSIFERK